MCGPDPLRGQGQGHRNLIEVERPIEEQFAAGEQPTGPRLPGMRYHGQQGRRDQVQPTIAVPDDGRLMFSPWQRRGRRDRYFGDREDLVEHFERRDGGIDHLATDRPGREDERPRILEYRHIGVAENDQALGLLVDQPQGTSHLVAVGGSGVEPVDGPHGDSTRPQMDEGIRSVRAHDMDHQVTGVDPGDGGQRHEPAERVQVEPWVFVDDTGKGPPDLNPVGLVRRPARENSRDGPAGWSQRAVPASMRTAT